MFEFAWPLVLALVEFCFKVHIHLWLLFHWLHVACQGVSNASVESIYVCCGIHLCSAYTIESSFELKIVHRKWIMRSMSHRVWLRQALDLLVCWNDVIFHTNCSDCRKRCCNLSGFIENPVGQCLPSGRKCSHVGPNFVPGVACGDVPDGLEVCD